ncbi:MAG: nucleoside hydrolase [Actinomycetota bacterium]|nr:nucleoside hydrolase [Actinomycetota bacterium]
MKKIIIDTDPATGYAFRDVDDALAVFYVLAFPSEFKVCGLTTVFGNASVRRTTRKAEEIIKVSGLHGIAVHTGAPCSFSLGKPTAASRFLIETARGNPGEITLLSIAPLTNVATAGRLDPTFYSNIGEIVIMGGALRSSNNRFFEALEFNFLQDPVSADEVMGAPCKKTLITSNLCRQVLFTRSELDALWQIENRVSTYLAYRIEPWLRLNQALSFLPWKGGFVPWDVIASIFLRRPDIFSGIESFGLKVRTGSVERGKLEREQSRDKVPTRVPMKVEQELLLEEFLRAIATL